MIIHICFCLFKKVNKHFCKSNIGPQCKSQKIALFKIVFFYQINKAQLSANI